MCSKSFSQSEFIVVSGRIYDNKTSLPVERVKITTNKSKKTYLSDSKGVFKFFTEPGLIKLFLFHDNYYPQIIKCDLQSDTLFEVNYQALMPSELIKQVEIIGTSNHRLLETHPGAQSISIPANKRQLSLGGEADLIKSLENLPGIIPVSEGSAEFSVRGGSHDQNLILLNKIPIYSCSNYFGLLSPFSPDWISKMKLYKGNIPAMYGGRLSSVLDISSRISDLNKTNLQGSFGLLSLSGNMDIPVIKNKLGIVVSGKRSHWDMWQKIFSHDNNLSFDYYYNYSASLNWIINSKNSLKYFVFHDRDQFIQQIDNQFESSSFNQMSEEHSNLIQSFQWLLDYGILENRLVIGTSSNKSIFKQIINTENNTKSNETGLQFGLYNFLISNYSVINLRHNIRIEAGITLDNFVPHSVEAYTQPNNRVKEYFHKTTFRPLFSVSEYLDGNYSFDKRITVSVGMRYCHLFYQEKILHYPQPRFAISFRQSQSTTLQFGYSRLVQNKHRLSNPGLGQPINLWIPATVQKAAQTGHQISFSYLHSIEIDSYKWNINSDIYFKTQQGILDFSEGKGPYDILFGQGANDETYSFLESGSAKIYGFEFQLEKKTGKTTGFLAYSYSRAITTFNNINRGIPFPSNIDMPHQIDIKLSYKLNNKMHFNLLWRFRSGRPFTFSNTLALNNLHRPISGSIYSSQGGIWGPADVIMIPGERNSHRMKPYHRLDISLDIPLNLKKASAFIQFGVYNVYNRMNPYYYFQDIDVRKNQNGKTEYKYVLKGVSFFPILPSVNLTFQFK